MANPSKKQEPRPYTALSVYLVQKWHREGMTIHAIGKVINRPVSQIRAMLKDRKSVV